jgi:hypothetical protein
MSIINLYMQVIRTQYSVSHFIGKPYSESDAGSTNLTGRTAHALNADTDWTIHADRLINADPCAIRRKKRPSLFRQAW